MDRIAPSLTSLPIHILHLVKVTKYVFSLSKKCEKGNKNDLALVHFHFTATPKLPFPHNFQALLFFLSLMVMSCTQNLHHILSQNQNNLLKSNLLHRHYTLSSCVPHRHSRDTIELIIGACPFVPPEYSLSPVYDQANHLQECHLKTCWD